MNSRRAALVGWLRRPDVQSDLLQVVKSVVAAVAAWILADAVLGLHQAFLAPWTALLTVHATVYRTVSRGTQAVLATSAGVALAFLAVQVGGQGVVTLAVALLVALLLARVGVLRQEGLTVATTVLFVITTASETGVGSLADRLAATALGVVVALLVNAAVAAPLGGETARRHIEDLDRGLGRLLQEMADGLREGADDERTWGWVDRTRTLDRRLESAWRLVYEAQESTWGNPRRRRAKDSQELSRVLERLEEGIAQVRGMARLIHESTQQAEDWDPAFRDVWVDLLDELGRRVAVPEADVRALRGDVDDLAARLSDADLAAERWPLYGALIEMTRVVIDIVDDVATSSVVREGSGA
ncbi:aromatic acid exporter family protein [Serinicoccus kebangsaanensis]|uniref:aromatic acid exporter family protein n=1 Tax=Serinicoccus kebangsaanensis TaxID=2602069 RepID=UPI00124F43A8|nr:aromatic acid exporter family protein [Serinicoccus kebangsaanensis]